MKTRTKHGQFEEMRASTISNVLMLMVSRLGLEPRALALKGRCSTD